jgi:alpha-ribazole phosphatase
MTRLLLARHGQTIWNTQRRYQGQSDSPLDETGQRQAAALGERLARHRLSAVYASDLGRVWNTAAAVAAHQDCLLIAEPRQRELHYGEWQGLTYDEILRGDPQRLATWEADRMKASPPGGESLQQLAERVQATGECIQKAYPEGTVLVVSHAGPIKVLICQALSLPPTAFWQFRLEHATLSALSLYPQGGILELLNDACHLEDNPWES